MTEFYKKNKKSKTKKRKITKSKKLKGGGTLKKSQSQTFKTERPNKNYGKPNFPGLPLKLKLSEAEKAKKAEEEEKRHIEHYRNLRSYKDKEINHAIEQNRKDGKYLSPLHKNSPRHMYEVTKSQEQRTPEKVRNLWDNEDLYADAAEAGVTVFDSPLKIYSPITGISNSPLKPETSPWKKIPQLNNPQLNNNNNNRRNNKRSK